MPLKGNFSPVARIIQLAQGRPLGEPPHEKPMTTNMEASNQRDIPEIPAKVFQRRLGAILEPGFDSPTERRTVRVIFKVSPSEERKLDELCDGIGRSPYIRAGLFGYSVTRPKADIPQINRDTYFELGRIGINLNQQTKALNGAIKAGHSLPLGEYLDKLTALEAMLKDLKAQIIETHVGKEASL